MAQTIITTTDPKTKKYWSSQLFTEFNKSSYFGRKFSGTGDNFVIQQKTDVESAPGDRISYDLSVRLRQLPTTGDNRLKGKEEALRFFSDEVVVDQTRHSVSAGGRMTRKRTMHDMRKVGKNRLSEYWTKWYDEYGFITLSGARGVNPEFIEPTTFSGFANNSILAPDTDHILYGGSATSKATLTTTDKMSRALVERAATKADMIAAVNPDAQNIRPVSVDGEDHYVLVMNPWQSYDLRVADTAGWLDIQKAATGAEGKNNPIFKGGLGMINNIVLHDHKSVIRFTDYGTGSNVAAARALFMGAQAAVVAWGTGGSGVRFSWEEEVEDYGNELTIAAGMILGMKKTRFNGYDFGVIALDTAAANPNP